MLITVVKVIIRFGLAMLVVDIVDYFFGGCSNNFGELIVRLPRAVISALTKIFDYVMLFFTAVLDGIISLIWNNVPGLSDVFDAPSASSVIN